jgi:hypothetical protein
LKVRFQVLNKRTTSISKRSLLAGLAALLPLLLVATPATGRAAPTPSVVDGTALTAERARLRDQLERVSAEIDALKKADRGVGDDYRLRARLADAEALARRLTDIDARLGLRAPIGRPAPLPIATSTDGPSDLDAKADILADQSRRVRGEADALGLRVAEIKARQELRRRAADLERDPFAPLEGSKRRVASIAATSGGVPSTPSAPLPSGAGAASGSSTAGPAPGAASGSPASAPNGGAQPVSAPTGGGTPVTVGTGTTSGAAAGPGTASPSPVTRGLDSATLSVELRDLLDPAAVADIRRLEGVKTPTGTVRALERAVAALRARADSLDSEARAMRTSAGQK